MSKQSEELIRELKHRVDQFARESRTKIGDHVVDVIKGELHRLPKTIVDYNGNAIEGIMTPDELVNSVRVIESEEGLEKLEATVLVLDQDALMSIDVYNKYLKRNVLQEAFAKAKMTTEMNIQKIIGA